MLVAILTLAGCSSALEDRSLSTYAPENLEDSFIALDQFLTAKEVERIREHSEEEMRNYHHGLGTALRNEWGLWSESRLSSWFNDLGIHHPDDMSAIILRSYWRYLNEQPIDLEEQVQFYKDYWSQFEDAVEDT